MDLNFRIVHVTSEKFFSDDEWRVHACEYMDRLKQHIETCGLIEVNLSFLKHKTSDEKGYHEIEELVFQVQARVPSVNAQHSKRDCYSEFLDSWRQLFKPEPSPCLILYESSYFISSLRRCHIANEYSDVSFGVLPYNGQFHEYASLLSEGYVDFFHETRNMKIKYRNLELTWSYNTIRNIFVNINSYPQEIFFDLYNPPIVYRVEKKRRHNSEVVFISYRTMLPENCIDLDVFGRSNVVRVSLADETIVEDIISKLHFQCFGKPVHFANIVSVQMPKPANFSVQLSHFGCTYLLTAILRRNFTMAAQAHDDMSCRVSEVKRLSRENSRCLERALTLVHAAVDSGKMVNYWNEIETQYRNYLKRNDEGSYAKYVIPESCRMIRRVTLTPTRQMLFAPEIMFSNRILRNFDSDYALRVNFRDDNNSRLSFNASTAEDIVFDLAIVRPMRSGIRIGSRTYKFLAWSNSQIREHGIWMYAEDSRWNIAEGIRIWMGKFSHIHSVSKYMARMGQCFSQTEDTVSLKLDEGRVRTEDDIERGEDRVNDLKPYCFSDGVGKISVKLANEVHQALGHDKLCSAFQIRYGGYKGMLVVDPELKDVDIVFRKSMKKFDAPGSTRLEIARTSAPIRLQLNRPLISILNDLGVPSWTFLRLQEEFLKNLTDILFEEKKAAAYLESLTPNELFGYKELSSSGIHLTTEPFFRSILLAIHRLHIGKVKSRTNIPIDPSEGRNMLGVLDETGELMQGEVFVQYTKNMTNGETTRDTVILERTVLVTKNPCLLPGDVRKFKAVDIPGLHHIVDCIVFPQNGDRPHSNEMAGSDMDGDEYAVLWNDDLIFKRDNETPGDFPSVQERYVENINKEDMIDFLVRYIKNDQVGTIANAHLAHADDSSIFSETCLAIARKFSVAVDFAKTGVCEHLDPDERPKRLPDFMEKVHKESYPSKKALGQLYRVARDYELENESANLSYHDVQVDEDLKFPGWEKYEESAVNSRNKFNALLKTIFRTYGNQHEAEVYSGAFTNLHSRFRERRDRDEIGRVVVRCVKRLTKSFQEEFNSEFAKSSNVSNIDLQILQKASAWYVVTYRDKDAEFLSFPWTVFKYLGLIKLNKVKLPLYISPIVQKMNQQIRWSESKIPLPPLPSEAEEAFQKYNFVSGIEDTKLALRTMMLWAREDKILKKHDQDPTGFMNDKTFVDLFLHVAKTAQYAVTKGMALPSTKGRDISSAAICLDFLKFCVTLRYYDELAIKAMVPFHVRKYTKLSEKAVKAYHKFAVHGKFPNLHGVVTHLE